MKASIIASCEPDEIKFDISISELENKKEGYVLLLLKMSERP